MGPNMMWNQKYGNMRAGMMAFGSNFRTAEMPVSEDEALAVANQYLQRNNSSLAVEGHPDRFYGYYTMHTLADDKISGMLSVNGYNGNVFIHTWHGGFIKMTEHEEDGHSD